MHIKKNNNIKSNNFTQGLRPISSSIPHGLKKVLKKSGYNFNTVVDNWTRLVGKEISTKCYPLKVKIGKNHDQGTLVINVTHGNEVDIEYSKKEILDKINSYFGYKYLEKIKLNVIQEKREVEIKSEIRKFNEKKILKNINSIKNEKLKMSINKLVRAFKTKND